MHKLKVENDATGDSWREDKEWGSWEENTCNHVEGIRLAKENDYSDVVADFEVKSGDIVYLVFAEYGSGDSFGHSSGNIEYIAVFKTKEKADFLKYSLEQREKKKDDNKFTFEYETESGTIIQNHCPWDGYFERLEGITVIDLIVE